MRRTTTALSVATVLLLAGAAMAQERGPQPGFAGEDRLFGPDVERGEGLRARRGERAQRGEARRHRLPPAVHEAILEQFDSDGDGRLSREERQAGGESLREAVKAALDELRAQLIAEFDVDGDGALSEDERLAAREAKRAEIEARRAELLERYDADESGRLEREEMEQAIADGEIPERPGRHGRRGRGGPGGPGGEGFGPPLDGDGPHGARGEFGPGPRHDGRGPHGRALSPELLERFDLDADGELSQEERHAAHDEMRHRFEQRRAEAVEEFDTDGDGALTGDEREAARAEIRRRVHLRLAVRAADVDGDGSLSAEELVDAGVRIVEGEPAMDANGDGVVNDADFEALANSMDAER